MRFIGGNTKSIPTQLSQNLPRGLLTLPPEPASHIIRGKVDFLRKTKSSNYFIATEKAHPILES